MKIGIDGRAAKWYRGTGIGTYTYQIINNLSCINTIDDYIVYLPENSSLNLSDKFTTKSTSVISNNNFWEEISIPNNLSDTKLDIYHIPQNGISSDPKTSCAKIITLHDIIPLKMPETVSNRYLNIFNTHMKNIIDNTDGIITVSEFSKQDISNEFNFPEDRIFVTKLAAEKIYKPLNITYCKNILKSKYSIQDNFFLYVGGFSPRKNILGIIESFSLLDSKIKKNYKLVITGKKGLSYKIYKSRAHELNISDNVIFTDFVPLSDMPIFYNAAEMLVYPSFYEGFGLPPLEAMACGTPVITSNITSLPEIYRESAILVNPYDQSELKTSMEKILFDSTLKSSLIKKGFNTSEIYSWKKTAIDTIHAYKKTIAFCDKN